MNTQLKSTMDVSAADEVLAQLFGKWQSQGEGQ
ncbi:hypothetical protein KIPB_014352, partial [Kipferlia bialata]|eukprot:g14352.t1